MHRLALAAALLACTSVGMAVPAKPAAKSPYTWHYDWSHGTSEFGWGAAWDNSKTGIYFACNDGETDGTFTDLDAEIDLRGRVTDNGLLTFPNGHVYELPMVGEEMRAYASLWADFRTQASVKMAGHGTTLTVPLLNAKAVLSPKMCVPVNPNVTYHR